MKRRTFGYGDGFGDGYGAGNGYGDGNGNGHGDGYGDGSPLPALALDQPTDADAIVQRLTPQESADNPVSKPTLRRLRSNT